MPDGPDALVQAHHHCHRGRGHGVVEQRPDVIGVCVLPVRLKGEMAQLKEAILNGADLRVDEVLAKHADWVEKFAPKYEKIDVSNIDGIIEKEIGLVFMEVLEDAGVYKRTPEGQAVFDRFIQGL